MEKKARKIIFIVCLFFFLALTPLVILYSQGYRIDIDSRKITQTGGLYLKAWPKSSLIYLDLKFKKKTDWFFGSALIENLVPKKYKISVEKEGFYPWEKTLEIKEKEVTTVENIILFPKNPDLILLREEVEDFLVSPDNKKMILETSTSEEKSWALKLYDLERNVVSHLIEEKEIYPEAELLGLDFSGDSEKISLEIGAQEQIKYFSLALDEPGTIVPLEKEELSQKNIITYYESGEEIYYLDNLGHLYKTNQAFDPQIKLSGVPFPVSSETEYKLEKFGNFIFLQEEETLYLFEEDLRSWEEFFAPLRGLRLSPDFKKKAYWSNHEIWILFIEDKGSQPQKRAGERLFLIRLSEKISSLTWLNSDYLVFNVGNKVKISEVDERDRLNIIDFAEFENSKIVFNNLSKKLYLLSDGKLYESERLLP